MSGRTNTRRMHQLRDAFFTEGKTLDANGDPAADCWLCKGRIDYTAPPSSTPDSHNLDHFHTVADRPDLQEDPSGFRHSHTRCNQQRGKSTPSPGLGEPVGDWW